MNYEEITDSIRLFLQEYPTSGRLIAIVAVLALSWTVYIITVKLLLRWIVKFTERTKTDLDDMLVRHSIFKRLAWIPPLIIIYNFTGLFGSLEVFIKRILTALIVLAVTFAIGSLLSILSEISTKRDPERSYQLKSYIQIARIILYLIGSIVIIAAFLGQSPFVLLSGVGAMTAVLLLIFRDTILSFVASMQISSYDLVKVGDWIEVPKFGADGEVKDIALHTVKVQNWDKTITVIPTHKLIEESFKNWRGMTQSGGRRIKRAINIDMSSVSFLDKPLYEKLSNMRLLKDYLADKQREIEQFNNEQGLTEDDFLNGRKLTNLGTFRFYLKSYLKNNPRISPDLTFLVRQLAPGPNGLPVEVYVFSSDTAWANYEDIQADIFDHIVAILPYFELRIHQYPTGADLQRISHLKL